MTHPGGDLEEPSGHISSYDPSGQTMVEALKELHREMHETFALRDGVAGTQGVTAIDLSVVWPVGSVYVNAVDGTDPGTLLGFGVWVEFGRGRVMVGQEASGTFEVVGSTGGAETHTLTTDEIPAHTHTISTPVELSDVDRGGDASDWSVDNTVISTTSSTGGGEGHDNLQPYVVVFLWRRVS